MSHPAVSLQGLSRSFDGVRAVDELTMTVPAGEAYGLLGPNGAGKTTTLKLLAGLISPDGGQAVVAGEVVGPGTTSLELRKRVGFLAEEPAFYQWMTAEEFLIFVGRLFQRSAAEAAARARELLRAMALYNRKDDRIRGFSRGMRQRLGIAQALMGVPQVLLLDEPASALDPIGRKEVLDLIASLSGPATIVMSSHILDDVQRVCTWVGIMNRGRLLVEAPLRELLRRYAQPVFHVEISDGRERLTEKLRREPWLREVVNEAGGLRVLAVDPEAAERRIPALVAAQDARLLDFTMVTPTLEDIFIHLVTDGGADYEPQEPGGRDHGS